MLFFKFTSGFWTGHGAQGSRTANFRIIYFDKGTSTWKLRYDAKNNSDKVATTVTNTNSLQWKEKKVTVTDGYFGQRGGSGSDFRLKTTTYTDHDPVFAVIEVTR